MELKRLCGEGKLSQETQVCAEGTQSWRPLSTLVQAPAGAIPATPAVPNQPQLSRIDQTKPCPMCGEQILAVAKKCKHCGELLDGSTARNKAVMDAPEIWNPTAAANWSVFFLPLGAYLHYRNAKILGRELEARRNFVWFWLLCVTFVVAVLMSGVPSLDPVIGLSFSVFMLVFWYLNAAKDQMHYVSKNFGSDYKRLGWFMPITLCIVLIIFFWIGLFILMWGISLLYFNS